MSSPGYPPPPQVEVPVCPRHPDRVSYVRCQRCNRPVCPECQRPAAVGVQCVDCVREAAAAMPVTRTAFGGVATISQGRVTYALIGICAVVYVAQLARPQLTNDLAFAPVVGWSEPWRVVTSAFAHSPQTFLHILFNMLCLWQIGPYLEALLGRLRFLLLYLICAVGGSAGVLLLATPPTAAVPQAVASSLYPAWFTAVVGASGAVFGLFGALLVLNRHLGRSTAGIGLVIVLNAAIGFIYQGIAWQAHLGGFVVGLACAAALTALSRKGRDQLRQYAVPVLLGILLVVVAVMVVKYSGVPAIYR